jgi:DNA repair exonuclease SbcCD nuclease subunit
VCGHFDIQGCLMQGNQICEHGIIPGAFNNHGIVLSGHFHKKSIHNNINYLGNPIATNWGESGDPHGWHFFDGATLDFREFVFPLYKKVYVNHSDKIEYVDDGSRFVKIFVNERNDFYFQQLISQIRQLEHVLQLQIIDDKQETVNAVEFDIEELKDDLLSLMKRTIDNSDYEQPEQMKLLISELYNKAQNSKIIVSG